MQNNRNRRGLSSNGNQDTVRNTKIHNRRVRIKKNGAGALKVFIVVISILLLAAVACGAVLWMYRPDVDDGPAFDTGDIEFPPVTDENGETVYQPGVSAGEYKRKDGVYNFLFIGKDRVAENTDVMMLISFDTESKDISVLQLPRDTYIEYEGNGRRINYLYASLHSKAIKDGAGDHVGVALDDLSTILEKNMCIKIDYHVMIDLDGFAQIVDAIDGVPIDVPYDLKYSDPEQGLYIDIKKGQQTLDGKTAEQFVRFRSGFVEGDIGRVDAQKIFLAAFLRQLKSSFTLQNIPGLVSSVFESILHTDISLADMVFFAKEAIGVELENATFVTLPGKDARANINSGAWYYIMARADTLAVINDYINVYQVDITDAIFDKARAFTSDADHINEIYEADAGKYSKDSYTADEINKNPPDILLT